MDGLNLYAYVGNNPVSLVDPLGSARSDYRLNDDGSVTFIGRGATIWEAVNLFEELGYENWREGGERFSGDYDAEDWWRDDGSWTGKKGAYLTDKTLYPKHPPVDPPSFIEPEPPTCEPERTIPPGPDDTLLPWTPPPGYWHHPPDKRCDPALGRDYYLNRNDLDCADRIKGYHDNERVTEYINKVETIDQRLKECYTSHKTHKEIVECINAMDAYGDYNTILGDFLLDYYVEDAQPGN